MQQVLTLGRSVRGLRVGELVLGIAKTEATWAFRVACVVLVLSPSVHIYIYICVCVRVCVLVCSFVRLFVRLFVWLV